MLPMILKLREYKPTKLRAFGVFGQVVYNSLDAMQLSSYMHACIYTQPLGILHDRVSKKCVDRNFMINACMQMFAALVPYKDMTCSVTLQLY